MSTLNQASGSPYYPVFLELRGARCVVVGGGSVAARKVRSLIGAGASVTVVSPQVCAELEAAAHADGALKLERRVFDPNDLDGALLAIAATDEPAVNEAVARAARARGLLVNVVDEPALSTFIMPATVSRGRLQVAVSTQGASPAFARRLRERLEGELDPGLADYLDRMAEVRAHVLERVPDPGVRRRIFEVLASDEFVAQYLAAEPSDADELFRARVRDVIAQNVGRVGARAERAAPAVSSRDGRGHMRIIALGVTHKTAPVEVRERLAIGQAELGERLRHACEHPNVAECVALSTCNRVELYAAVTAPVPVCFLKSIASAAGCADGGALEGCWLELDEPDSVQHLFEVVSGLDAMVVGEQEIVAQVKRAFHEAQAARAAGPVLGELFRKALSVSKRVRTETKIGHGALSVASVAVRLARDIFGELGGVRVMIVGAGDTAELTLRHLVKNGARSVVAVNRSFERAQALAQRFDGRVARFERMLDELAAADIVIGTTASPEPILTADALRQVVARRRGRPMFVIDIAVPRDVEPDAARLEGVHLYNVDDLEALVREHLATRALELDRCRAIVDEETRRYERWLQRRETEPTLKQLYRSYEVIRARELADHLQRFRGLTPELREQFGRFTEHLVRQLLHGPVSRLRRVADPAALTRHIETLDELFGSNGDQEVAWRDADVAQAGQEVGDGDADVGDSSADKEEAARE